MIPTTQNITGLLWDYTKHIQGADEAAHALKTIDFIQRTPKAFDRDHEALGHVGASAAVTDSTGEYILLTRHTVMDTWAIFGNHCDGETNLLEVARGRIKKDTSATFAAQCEGQANILDVDVHYVPAHERKGEQVPAHLHYDIAFHFISPTMEDLPTNNRWFPLTEVQNLPNLDPQHRRIFKKLAR